MPLGRNLAEQAGLAAASKRQINLDTPLIYCYKAHSVVVDAVDLWKAGSICGLEREEGRVTGNTVVDVSASVSQSTLSLVVDDDKVIVADEDKVCRDNVFGIILCV